jgi:hypothetical protein
VSKLIEVALSEKSFRDLDSMENIKHIDIAMQQVQKNLEKTLFQDGASVAARYLKPWRDVFVKK